VLAAMLYRIEDVGEVPGCFGGTNLWHGIRLSDIADPIGGPPDSPLRGKEHAFVQGGRRPLVRGPSVASDLGQLDTDLDTKRFETGRRGANKPDRLEAKWLVRATEAHHRQRSGRLRSS
jgi:hypothetical protein